MSHHTGYISWCNKQIRTCVCLCVDTEFLFSILILKQVYWKKSFYKFYSNIYFSEYTIANVSFFVEKVRCKMIKHVAVDIHNFYCVGLIKINLLQDGTPTTTRLPLQFKWYFLDMTTNKITTQFHATWSITNLTLQTLSLIADSICNTQKRRLSWA